MSKRSMLFKWANSHTSNLITGAAASIFGYFAPVAGIMSVVVAAILFDMVVGIIAASKKGHGIKSKKLWRTVKKIFYSVAVISLLYAGDVEIGFIALHKAVAWFIFGFEMWSILEKVSYLVDHDVFRFLEKFMKDKIEQNSGISTDE